jgi:hypothetical protein
MCGVPCILIILLWFRSYQWNDEFYFSVSRGHAIVGGSIMGHLTVKVRGTGRGRGPMKVLVRTDPANSVWPEMAGMLPKFAVRKEATDWALYTPHWLAVTVLAAMFVPTWIGKRFSLRTLLLATTFTAVLLGAIVYAIR